MGTKRDPSSPLDKLDTVKRQNIEQHPEVSQPTESTMDYAKIKQEMQQELTQIREELRGEIVTATKKVGDALRDEIAMVSKKIGEICISHGSVLKSLQFHSNYLETLNEKAAKLDLGVQTNVVRMDKVDNNLRRQGNMIKRVDCEVQDYGREVKAKNIVINGLTEKKGENTIKLSATFLKNLLPKIEAKDIENAFRMGAPGEPKRSILVKLKSMDTKKEIKGQEILLKEPEENEVSIL